MEIPDPPSVCASARAGVPAVPRHGLPVILGATERTAE